MTIEISSSHEKRNERVKTLKSAAPRDAQHPGNGDGDATAKRRRCRSSGCVGVKKTASRPGAAASGSNRPKTCPVQAQAVILTWSALSPMLDKAGYPSSARHFQRL